MNWSSLFNGSPQIIRPLLVLTFLVTSATGLIFLGDTGAPPEAPVSTPPLASKNPRRAFETAGPNQWMIVGEAGIKPGGFKEPRGIAELPDGGFAVGDRSGRVQCFNTKGEATETWQLEDHKKGNPRGVGVLRNGHLLLCDTHYSCLLETTQEGKVVRRWGGPGKDPGQFALPQACAVDLKADVVYVLEYGWYNDRIQKFSMDGSFLKAWGSYGDQPGQFMRGTGISLDSKGDIWVSDSANHRIQKFSPDGEVLAVVGELGSKEGQLRYPFDIACAPDGKIYVAEYGNHRISVFNEDGTFDKWLGGPGPQPGRFFAPWNLTVTRGGHLLVSDTGNHRIQILKVSEPAPDSAGGVVAQVRKP